MVASLIHFCYIIGYTQYLCVFLYYISALISYRKYSGSVVSEQAALVHFFQCMSPTMSKYIKLGLELVSLEENIFCTPKKPSMAEEKKNNGADDPISMLLEQALTRQRDEMMENFPHILQCLQIKTNTSSSNDHFGIISK